MSKFKGYNFNGVDGNVKCTVNQVEDKLFKIYAMNLDTGKVFEEEYTCLHTTTDGIELIDNNNMEDIVEKAIERLSK